MSILEKMLERCEQAGYATTKNVEKIAKAKKMMFGDGEWGAVLVTDKMQPVIAFLKPVVPILSAMVNVIAIVIAKKHHKSKH
jgi:hypothetical protein